MDGDARGGAALSVKSVTGLPIKFIGTGRNPMLSNYSTLIVWLTDFSMGDMLTLLRRLKRCSMKSRLKRWRKDTFLFLQSGRLPGAITAGKEDGPDQSVDGHGSRAFFIKNKMPQGWTKVSLKK